MRNSWMIIGVMCVVPACTAGGSPSTTAVPATTTTSAVAVATTSTAIVSTTTVAATTTTAPATIPPLPSPVTEIETFAVPAGSRPHDVAPAPDGPVWYTAQRRGSLGLLDPSDGSVTEIPLGQGSAPHGVIVGPDGAAWVTDGGLNAIVRVDASTHSIEVHPLDAPYANLNTAVFDGNGVLWFTGQEGIYGRLDPATSELQVFEAPGGSGPYGIAAAPDGRVFYASLAGSHIAEIHTATGQAEMIEAFGPDQGARRVWSDSNGVIWVSEWNVGRLGRYEPDAGRWNEYELPGAEARAYAVYVDDTDRVWLSDFAGDGAVVRFDPPSESFETFSLATPGGDVRQLLGRQGEVWAPLSASDEIMVFRYGD